MLNLLKAASLISATKDTRYYLNGVHIFRTESGAVWLEASDGHIAMRAPVMPEFIRSNTQSPFDLIVPIEVVKMVIKNLDHVVLDVDDLCFSDSIKFKPIDGRYPNMERVLNLNQMSRNNPSEEFGLSSELVIKVMKAVSFVADTGSKYARWPALWQVKANDDPILIKTNGVKFVIMPARI